MSGTVTQADISGANWAGEAAAAAEAYAENQADEAARQRDAERARQEAGDGVDPPGGGGDGSPGTDPMFGGTPGSQGPGRPGAGGSAPGQSSPPGAVKLSDQDVGDLRASGMNVTSVGNGLYVINAPNSPSTDVNIKETTPPDPERTTWLPGSNTPTTTPVPNNNPPAGAPDPVNDAGAPAETKPPETPEAKPFTTGVGEDVDKIMGKSPTLQKHLQELKDKGYRIEYGKVGVGGVGADDKVIYIDPSLKGKPEKIASVISHEVGHVLNPPAKIPPQGLSMEEHSRRQVDSYLNSEGAAVLENMRAHEEGGLEIAGFQPDARYEQVYNDLKANRISEQEAISRFGQIYGDGELHGDTRVTYRDHFTQTAQQDWTKAQNSQ